MRIPLPPPPADAFTITGKPISCANFKHSASEVTGSGLGLAITADCIQAMGGTIQCESTVGVGSRFLITLPLKPPQARNRSSVLPEQGDAS